MLPVFFAKWMHTDKGFQNTIIGLNYQAFFAKGQFKYMVMVLSTQ